MKSIAIKRACIFILATSSCAFAQQGRRLRVSQNAGPGPVTVGLGAFGKDSGAPVQGAPYSATIKNESVQALADGNRIVHNSTGTIARDSQGRTRRDTTLPAIGNLSVSNVPHLIFVQDPVAQTSYTLNLTDKTAHKMPMPPGHMGGMPGPGMGPDAFFVQVEGGPGPFPPPLPPPNGVEQGRVMILNGQMSARDQGQVATENLGSQTMEGVYVTGVRTTRTIPAGQIGNDKAISIVTEVWTSPDLKTIVYSKRSDPRMGEQTFQLTNISRSEPDPSLFTVPADFKVIDGPKPIFYRQSQ